MKKQLCIGIYHITPAWRALLNQIGVWYEEIIPGKDLYENYSAIIVNKSEKKERLNEIRGYLKQGGNVIFVNDDYGSMPDKTFKRKYFKRVYNDLSLDSLRHIPYLDLYTTVKTTGQAMFSGLMGFKKVMNGTIAFIGFDPAELLFRTDYTRKRFSTAIGTFPDEIVSKVSKGKVSDLFHQIIREIHFRAELPFIRKWISPKETPVFCFRVDSDYSDKEHIDKVYSLLDDHKIKATWFLHVKAHEHWLPHFSEFTDQEVALHGYKHGTSKSEKKVTDNISMGFDKLSDSGFITNGYCAPYGIYNQALEKSLGKFEFKYTSEFTFAYDSLPLKSTEKLFQIPIHPICTGSLKRKRYTIEEMRGYFHEVMKNKLALQKPVIFYHHPLQSGLEIFESIFKKVKDDKLTNLTFNEYTDFWQRREKCLFEAYYESDTSYIENVSDESLLFEVSIRHGASKLIRSNGLVHNIENKSDIEYDISHINKYVNRELSFIDKLKLFKTSILDYRNRERL